MPSTALPVPSYSSKLLAGVEEVSESMDTMNMTTAFNPPATFRAYILRNAEYALTLVSRPLTTENLKVVLQALQYVLQLGEGWQIAKALITQLGPQMDRLGAFSVWLPLLEQALIQAIRLKDRESEMVFRFYIGRLLMQMARFEESLLHHETGLEIADELEDTYWRIRFYNRLGFLLRRKRKLAEAEQMVMYAQYLMSEQDIDEQGYACLVLGAIRYDQRRWQEAYQHFQCSLEKWYRGSDERKVAHALSNLGLAAMKLERLTEGEMYFLRAIELLEHLGDPHSLGIVCLNLGLLLSEDDRPIESLPYLRRADTLFRMSQDRWHLAMVATNLGRTYYELEHWSDAVNAFEVSLALWRELEQLSKELNAYVGLAAALAQVGEIDRSRELVAEGTSKLPQLPEDDRAFLTDAFERVLQVVSERAKEI